MPNCQKRRKPVAPLSIGRHCRLRKEPGRMSFEEAAIKMQGPDGIAILDEETCDGCQACPAAGPDPPRVRQGSILLRHGWRTNQKPEISTPGLTSLWAPTRGQASSLTQRSLAEVEALSLHLCSYAKWRRMLTGDLQCRHGRRYPDGFPRDRLSRELTAR